MTSCWVLVQRVCAGVYVLTVSGTSLVSQCDDVLQGFGLVLIQRLSQGLVPRRVSCLQIYTHTHTHTLSMSADIQELVLFHTCVCVCGYVCVLGGERDVGVCVCVCVY